ncbi:D-alanine--poly(phosphoribitol) ligase subunit DltC [Bacillus massiliigorillae]|uniref:D-alanine--poly(phosphoribitol) ligase subunit DltC n=1 Tax=Bacillus massiliigorillae TaxID=1243664 RepID=UPI0003A280DB|nr:D-alanine--poly(phosphoribitol) ligase subunit DltC [Bacillus massiliigorillae]
MAFREEVLDLLEEVTESEVVQENPSINLFDEGLLDSLGTVQLIVEIEERLGILVPVSEFDRDEWATPNQIISKLEELR